MSDSVDRALLQEVVDAKVTLAKAKIQAEFKEEINQSIKAGLDDALKDFRDQVKNEIELVTRTVRAEAEGQTAKALQEVASTSVDNPSCSLQGLLEVEVTIETGCDDKECHLQLKALRGDRMNRLR